MDEGARATIAARVAEVRARVAEAAARVGRDPAEVTIVAVSKTFPADAIAAAVAAGIADIGESRVQELRGKKAALSGEDIRWHLVGPLQRNKVRHVAGQMALIHSIDSARIGEAVATRARATGAVQDVLLEVNVGGERAKHGVAIAEAEEAADALASLEGIRLRGLMTIPPEGDPAAARAVFSRLRALRDRIATRHPDVRDLSMGMSADHELAVEEGATLVRVGTAIFGARQETASG